MPSSSPSKILFRAYTFDDVVILPSYSNVLPSDTLLKTKLTSNLELAIPILSAAMDTVTEHQMAAQLALEGGLGIIHKNMTADAQAEEVKRAKILVKDKGSKNARYLIGAASGVSVQDLETRIPTLVNAGIDVLTIDTAHGHSEGVLQAVRNTKKQYGKQVTIIAGNIATGEAARALVDAGADIVKVGIGPGSICTTRVVAGIGMPQLSAILEVSAALKGTSVGIVADGGIKYSGDIVKALAAGAHAVMVGNLLAGTDETPGERINFQGKVFKRYRGMGSLGAMRDGSKDRYFQHGAEDKKLVPEGIEGMVPYRGNVSELLHQICGGIRAGLGYVGARDIAELEQKARFVEVSSAGLKESHVYNVTITEEAPNYSIRKD